MFNCNLLHICYNNSSLVTLKLGKAKLKISSRVHSFFIQERSILESADMSNGKFWSQWQCQCILEVPFSMAMSMPMFLLEGFSMAMPMSILFQVLYQCQCQWQCLMLCLNVNSNANVLPCLEKATITIR